MSVHTLCHFRKSASTRERRGFTLVELLVVIAIIGVMMGLLLPAIMGARSAARVTTCMDAQRNLATALLTYHSNRQALPYYERNGWSWERQILEELGLGKIDAAISDGGSDPSQWETPPVQKEFKCPAGDADARGASYVVNAGTHNTSVDTNNYRDAKFLGSGLFFNYVEKARVKKSLSSVTDGTSSTILLSENLKNPYRNLKNGNKLGYVISSTWHHASQNNSQQAIKNTLGITWVSSNSYSTAVLDCNYSSSSAPRSRHANINNITFADGSVRSISKSIYYGTYSLLMAPDDRRYFDNSVHFNDPNYQ